MRKALQCLYVVAMLCAAPLVSAESVSGTLQFHNQVIRQTVTVENMHGLLVWTNSAAVPDVSGFDTILAVWNSSGVLIGLSDDDPLNQGVGLQDSALIFPALEAGVYTIGLSMYGNFPSGPLADGYWSDNDTPVPIQNEGCQAGCANYQLNWATGTTLPIPEPSTYAMLLAGLGVVGAYGRARLKQGRQI